MKKAVFALGALAIGLVTADAAAKWVRGGDASVTFLATGPGGLQIKGSGTDLTVDDKGDTVTVVVPLKDIDTGIALRNKHMRDKYLEVAKYPTVELTVSRAEIRLGASGEGAGDANGTMKLHGQSKPVRFHYAVKRSGAASNVAGSLRVNMKDFGIEEPSFMGATVKPEVDVNVTFGMKDG